MYFINRSTMVRGIYEPRVIADPSDYSWITRSVGYAFYLWIALKIGHWNGINA